VPPRHCTGIERPLTRFPISHHNERSFCALLLTIKRIVAKYFAMRFPSFFTPSSSTNTGAAAILLGFSLWASSVRAQDRTTEAGEAAITDPNQECTPYTYSPVASVASSFPANWGQPAVIVSNDTEALNKWNSIKSSIPTNIPVKGTVKGDFSNFTPTYNTSDPDCWWTYDKCDTPKLAGLSPDVINIPEPLSLGYGFDDGPNCSHNAFYNFLTSNKQKATMYYIGSNVQNWPLEGQRALADGHEICVHTWSHPYLTAVQSESVFAELWYTMKMIKLAIGVTPTCMRPPYGDIDDRVRAVAKALGLRIILWQSDSFDWEVGSTPGVTPATVDTNYQNLINGAQNGTYATSGTIMLTHEINNFTMTEAIKWYPMLKAAFKAIVPVGVGYNITQPYLETNYSLPSFSQYVGGQLTASGSASASSTSGSSSAQGGSKAGAAMGMPTASSGLIVSIVTVAALLGGVARVLA